MLQLSSVKIGSLKWLSLSSNSSPAIPAHPVASIHRRRRFHPSSLQSPSLPSIVAAIAVASIHSRTMNPNEKEFSKCFDRLKKRKTTTVDSDLEKRLAEIAAEIVPIDILKEQMKGHKDSANKAVAAEKRSKNREDEAATVEKRMKN
ncbi:uncharacterized protein LOC125202004 isoform X1 [Salvia hispanica]|uniref:uncharacterized protein LOC125202004 isoform X1 n=1 Tax=Salvia hispanica TaxID=49212 RepID=UPI0020093AFF|nr:uncharacterized protein LOC125202004 isoform X1 [Salvia hispanica]